MRPPACGADRSWPPGQAQGQGHAAAAAAGPRASTDQAARPRGPLTGPAPTHLPSRRWPPEPAPAGSEPVPPPRPRALPGRSGRPEDRRLGGREACNGGTHERAWFWTCRPPAWTEAAGGLTFTRSSFPSVPRPLRDRPRWTPVSCACGGDPGALPTAGALPGSSHASQVLGCGRGPCPGVGAGKGAPHGAASLPPATRCQERLPPLLTSKNVPGHCKQPFWEVDSLLVRTAAQRQAVGRRGGHYRVPASRPGVSRPLQWVGLQAPSNW